MAFNILHVYNILGMHYQSGLYCTYFLCINLENKVTATTTLLEKMLLHPGTRYLLAIINIFILCLFVRSKDRLVGRKSCEKVPRRVPTHHQLGLYKPGPFAGSTHRANDVPQACYLLDSSLKMTCCQWAIVMFYHLAVQS